jgi:transcriptional regulator with XRE-family HTH domain
MRNNRHARPMMLSEDDLKSIGTAVENALYRATYDLIAQVRADVVDELRFAPLAAELAQARTRRNLDVKTVAKMVKIPQYVIQRIERGSLPDVRPDGLERLADFLGMKDRLDQWNMANPELAQRLGTPKEMSRVLALIEQQALAEYLHRSGSGTPPVTAGTSSRLRSVSNLDGKMLQLEIVLESVQPPVWRRVKVPSATTLKGLHEVIQTSMGWTDSHLYLFEIDDTRYCDLDLVEDADPADRDARKTRLAHLSLTARATFRYEYDFGDGWSHRITVERIVESDGASSPACLGGARACPPEDCGGPNGYEELLIILGDPTHPEYDERRQWAGEDFDPDAFDVSLVSASLAHRGRRRKK